MRSVTTMLIIAVLAVGCTKTDTADKSPAQEKPAAGQAGTPESPGPAKTPVPAAAAMEGDHQVVHVVVTDAGYAPASIQFKAGVPARIVFKQETDSHCLSQVKIDDFGIAATDLPLNQETTVEFTPGQTGTYSFTCGMDMARGTIIVAS